MGVHVGEMLRHAARNHPERTAVVDLSLDGLARRELSYGELDLRARKVAATLAQLGVPRGGTVALLAENSAELIAGWFGIVFAGSAVVPISILATPHELALRLAHAGCRAVLHDRARTELAHAAVALAGSGCECVELAETCTSAIEPVGDSTDVSPSEVAMVLYTSGTTADPKGAAISHASLFTHTTVLAHHALKLTRDDRVLGVLPLSHSYGCRMVMLASFFAGARVVMLPRFHATVALSVIEREAITWMPVVPTMLAAWVAEAHAAPRMTSLRWVLSAGSPLSDEIARRAEAVLGVEVRQGYGMTEATFAAINAPPDERVIGSVGRPVFGVHVRVIDETGRDAPIGATGEIWIRGHNVMNGYLGKEPVLGFVHSGDLGRFDAAGRLYVVDRLKDLVIRGGHNVYPSEVEDALMTHPAVREVAVIGRPDDYYGEEVVAVIVLHAGASASAEELYAHALEQVSRIKAPREVAFVTSLPLGPSGKVNKRLLREQLASGSLAVTRLFGTRET